VIIVVENIVVPNTDENIDRCLCPECPVFNDCMKENYENLFCSKGNTVCEFNKTGCNCPTCPVWLEYELVSLFYCEKGAEVR
jgi:aldose sugar dehydrogenase